MTVFEKIVKCVVFHVIAFNTVGSTRLDVVIARMRDNIPWCFRGKFYAVLEKPLVVDFPNISSFVKYI